VEVLPREKINLLHNQQSRRPAHSRGRIRSPAARPDHVTARQVPGSNHYSLILDPDDARQVVTVIAEC
jgi:hypothetical protein